MFIDVGDVSVFDKPMAQFFLYDYYVIILLGDLVITGLTVELIAYLPI